MILIHHNANFLKERAYIYELIFCDILGLTYSTVIEPRNNVLLELEEKSIVIDDTFFQMGQDSYLTIASLPQQPLKKIINMNKALSTSEEVPVIYGNCEGKVFSVEKHDSTCVGVDVFGSAFFMLTRYEEIVKSSRDEWGRFSAMDSLAYQENFLERPLINEYIELLWTEMRKLWPQLQRKKRDFTIMPTHDVDVPFELAFLSCYQLLHTLAGDLLKRKSLTTFFTRLKSILQVKTGNLRADVNYTFDDIMTFSEKNGLKSRFYFMTAQNISPFDGNYEIEHPEILKLIKNIALRGHEIGIHPSFASFKDGERIKKDCTRLQAVLRENKIACNKLGGRQHYLRWTAPETWQYYEDAGLAYDTTLSFADHIGFRCGICYEYHPFNVRTRKKLNLLEYPLIVMECSGLDERYMQLSYDEMLQRCVRLKAQCEKHHGNFVILWHNSRFRTEEERETYFRIIR